MSDQTSMPQRLDQRGAGLITTLINLIFGIIVTLVALRMLFMLFNANPLNGFVSWIYSMSAPLVAPFAGIFQDVSILNGRLEMQTLVALVIYTLAASIINWLLLGSARHSHSV